MPMRVRRGSCPFLPDRLGTVPALRGHPSPVAPNDPTRCPAPARTLDSAPHGIIRKLRRHFVRTGSALGRRLAGVYRGPIWRRRRRGGLSAGGYAVADLHPGTERLSYHSCHFVSYRGDEKVLQAANADDAPDVG